MKPNIHTAAQVLGRLGGQALTPNTKHTMQTHIQEAFGPYSGRCPECKALVDTVPAEGVPDQDLRGCPNCDEAFHCEELWPSHSRDNVNE